MGKARGIYSALSVEDIGQYEVVKINILNWFQKRTGKNFGTQRKEISKPTWNLEEKKRCCLIAGVYPKKLIRTTCDYAN